MHGVSLSIGTVDPLNSSICKNRELIDWVKPAWVSDHLCWTGVAHKNTHDLLPVPYTEEALKHIVQRIRQVGLPGAPDRARESYPSRIQPFLDAEVEFIARMAEEANCRLEARCQ